MKKYIVFLVMLMVLTLTVLAHADPINPVEVLSKIPMKAGIAYSLTDYNFHPSASVELIGKWGLSLDAGYVGEDELAVFINYKLKWLEKFAEVPIMKYVDLEVGAYYGADRIIKMEAGEDYGINIKFVEIKF